MIDFSKILRDWYAENARVLPWRDERDPYKVWLSEIILQQTRISQGTDYYHRFIENFPTVQDLAVATEEQVLKCWQGLGYYSRARNLHHTAQKITIEYNGIFPKTYKGLLSLKGVGDYTASAIGSFCYDLPHAVLDGNVYRVLSRVFGINIPINTTEGNKYFKTLAQELLCIENPAHHNQAIMDFGAVVCTAQNPNCMFCIFSKKCVAYEKKMIKNLPVKLKKITIKKRYFNFLVVIQKNKTVILEKRTVGIWKGLYQFPMIETDKKILENEIFKRYKDRYNTSTTPFLFNEKEWIHKLTHQHLYVKFWILNSTKKSEEFKHFETYPVPILLEKFWKVFTHS